MSLCYINATTLRQKSQNATIVMLSKQPANNNNNGNKKHMIKHSPAACHDGVSPHNKLTKQKKTLLSTVGFISKTSRSFNGKSAKQDVLQLLLLCCIIVNFHGQSKSSTPAII